MELDRARAARSPGRQLNRRSLCAFESVDRWAVRDDRRVSLARRFAARSRRRRGRRPRL